MMRSTIQKPVITKRRAPDFFKREVGNRLEEPFSEAVSHLILATDPTGSVHESTGSDRKMKLLVDLDLSILGSGSAEYRSYAMAIRAEYSHVSDADFVAGRSKILESFLSRERIYETEFFSELEMEARKNIQQELAELLQE